ncbi:hypothetical protein AVEN_117997-1 [Araneus ventricosus]|uniref:Uncharacterized protein n=1 Tax=Araneus ventricosus TaxID=182803 RepID=A0A4Y2C8G6_ARAVE|nr:hypothetical protein AVEN_117997-1 [Araneus ventricosus]
MPLFKVRYDEGAKKIISCTGFQLAVNWLATDDDWGITQIRLTTTLATPLHSLTVKFIPVNLSIQIPKPNNIYVQFDWTTGRNCLLPENPSDPIDCHFRFRRLQFRVKVCYTQHSSGAELKVASEDLKVECFSPGQYIAVA